MIDFKLTESGDISLDKQVEYPKLNLKFGMSEFPKLRITFRGKTRKQKKKSHRLRIEMMTMTKEKKNSLMVPVLRDNEEISQSLAIRLKTELGELQNFFADFGSELSRMRHTDLLSEKNHERIKAYVTKAISDILLTDEAVIKTERVKTQDGNFAMETLKISIQDKNGKNLYTYTI